MTGDDISHGTYAAYQRHRKAGLPPCEECRAAATEYARERRRASTQVRKREMDLDAARRRAWVRLARMHPTQFRVLYAEELGE